MAEYGCIFRWRSAGPSSRLEWILALAIRLRRRQRRWNSPHCLIFQNRNCTGQHCTASRTEAGAATERQRRRTEEGHRKSKGKIQISVVGVEQSAGNLLGPGTSTEDLRHRINSLRTQRRHGKVRLAIRDSTWGKLFDSTRAKPFLRPASQDLADLSRAKASSATARAMAWLTMGSG